jgi:hypothetical protein
MAGLVMRRLSTSVPVAPDLPNASRAPRPESTDEGITTGPARADTGRR